MSITEQQRSNRLALADHLEKNVKDEQYNHFVFTNENKTVLCAAGHAANIGIGGMGWTNDIPTLNGAHYLPSVNSVFGEHITDIFYPCARSRETVISMLRNYEA